MERSTVLNKILKPSSCKPLGESVPRDMALKLFFPILFLFLIAGCGAFQTSTIPWEADRPSDYQALLEKLDAAVIKAGVHDAAEVPVAGFPYLRANRFAASLAGTLPDAAAKNAWVKWMSDLDLAAREKEIRNLPAESVTALAANREDLLLRVRACSKDLSNYDRGHPDFIEILTPRVKVPGEYSAVLRIIGLYPLITLPEYKITDGVRERIALLVRDTLQRASCGWITPDLQAATGAGKGCTRDPRGIETQPLGHPDAFRCRGARDGCALRAGNLPGRGRTL
jgi:hypothetical protein